MIKKKILFVKKYIYDKTENVAFKLFKPKNSIGQFYKRFLTIPYNPF